jgi:hypothetical protein
MEDFTLEEIPKNSLQTPKANLQSPAEPQSPSGEETAKAITELP